MKPTTIHSFLKFIGAGNLWSTVPTANGYRAILDTAVDVAVALSDYGPVDLIDIQSVMYVCAAVQNEQNQSMTQAVLSSTAQSSKLSPPFDRIFPSYEIAEIVFEIIRAVFVELDIQNEEDQRFSLTLPQKYGGDDLNTFANKGERMSGRVR